MQQGLQTPNGAFWKLEKRFWECRHRISPLSRAEGDDVMTFLKKIWFWRKCAEHSSTHPKVLIHSSKLNYTLIHSSKNQLHTHPLIQKPTTHSSTHPKLNYTLIQKPNHSSKLDYTLIQNWPKTQPPNHPTSRPASLARTPFWWNVTGTRVKKNSGKTAGNTGKLLEIQRRHWC